MLEITIGTAPSAGQRFAMISASGIRASMNAPPLAPDDQDRRALVALLGHVARGDSAALASVYQRTSAKLYGICVRLLRDEAEAQDVLQDVYVTLWQKASQFDSERASPITWLAVMARNKAIDRLRKRQIATVAIDAAAEVPDGAPSALEIAEMAQASSKLAECLNELDERARTMIRAAFLDGSTHSELAERESVPLGTVKSWIWRGLQRLRGCLEG